MKKLIIKEAITAFVVIGIFAIAFSLFDGWAMEGAERYLVAFRAAGIVGFISIFIAVFAATEIAGAIAVAAIVGALAAAVIPGFLAIADGVVLLTVVFIVCIVVFACVVSAAVTNNHNNQEFAEPPKSKVILSLFLEAVVIFASVSAMIFI